MTKKSKLIILISILVLVIAAGVYFLVPKEKKPVPEVLTFLQKAEKIIPYIAPYESAFLFDENKVFSAKGYSPHTLIDVSYIPYDTFRDLAKDICAMSGDYHLITMDEWGIIAQAAKEENSMPRGNNDKGKSKEIPEEECQLDPKKERTCLTGTGPSSWCYQGICDLNGNLAEWVDFPDVVDGIVKIDGKEFTLIPANYDMEKALGKQGVEDLIPEALDPNPNEKYVSGASIMIDTNSEDFDYPKTIPIKKDTVLGDFDQFRNGDGKNYGDGKYYFGAPTYDKNGDGKEEGAADVYVEILVCENFDGNSFKNCKNFRGLKLEKSQIKKEQRIFSVSPSLIFPEEKFEDIFPLEVKGFITSLREEPELKNLAISASISLSPSGDYGSDIYRIAPYGKRYAIRGGGYDDGKTSGVFSLEILMDQLNINSWNVTYRCVENYEGWKQMTSYVSDLPVSEVELLPISQPEIIPENTWVKVLRGENNEIFYSIDGKGNDIYICGLEKNTLNEGDNKLILSHLNSQGEIIFSKIFKSSSKENPISSIGFSTKITEENNCVVTGWLMEKKFENDKEDIFLIKTAQDGKNLWRKILRAKGREIGYDISQTVDGGYLIAGSVFPVFKEDSDIIVIRLDKEGNVMFAKTFDYENHFDIAYTVKETQDGGILVGGRFADRAGEEEAGIWHYFENEKAILMKLDKEGNIMFAKTFGGNFGNARIFSIEETLEGDLLVGGETYSSGAVKDESSKMPKTFQSKNFLLKTDKSGEIKWGKTFGIDKINLVMAQTIDKDGNCIAVTSSGPAVGRIGELFDAALFKFSSEGELLFERVFSKSGIDTAFSVLAEDDGYFVIGKSTSFSKDLNHNGLLLKLNKQGNIKDCPFLKEPSQDSVFLENFNSEIKNISLKTASYKLEVREGKSLLAEDLVLEKEGVCP